MEKMLLAGLLALWCYFAALFPSAQTDDGTLRLLFWNLENYFDWRNDSTSVSDAEFSSFGERRWTRKRFRAKSQAVAKTLCWVASDNGAFPDVVGFAEVENRFVLRRLLQESSLRKLDYEVVHYDSPDPRGIDVALLYRSSVLELVKSRSCHVYTDSGTVLPTRDILLVRLRKKHDGEEFAVLVSHLPSKYGGVAISAPKREAAVRRLRFLADSLRDTGTDRIVAMGDFNDTPDNPVFRLLEPALINLAAPLYRQGHGTIRYNGKWDMIDMFFVSPALSVPRSVMKILHVPFLETPDKTHGGLKPLRTYVGPRYTGGVSDHCPVLLELQLPP